MLFRSRVDEERFEVGIFHGDFAHLPALRAVSGKPGAALSALEPRALPGYPKNTVALMRAGYLFEQDLYAEARQELLAALRTDPGEPSLHVMLGHVYERTGLPALAGEEFDEAQYLSSRTP